MRNAAVAILIAVIVVLGWMATMDAAVFEAERRAADVAGRLSR